jgi:antitoxin HicB
MQERRKTKQAMAKQLHTSRSQLDRLLDPQNVSVTLDTIARAARALGKRLIIRVADAKVKRA